MYLTGILTGINMREFSVEFSNNLHCKIFSALCICCVLMHRVCKKMVHNSVKMKKTYMIFTMTSTICIGLDPNPRPRAHESITLPTRLTWHCWLDGIPGRTRGCIATVFRHYRTTQLPVAKTKTFLSFSSHVLQYHIGPVENLRGSSWASLVRSLCSEDVHINWLVRRIHTRFSALFIFT